MVKIEAVTPDTPASPPPSPVTPASAINNFIGEASQKTIEIGSNVIGAIGNYSPSKWIDYASLVFNPALTSRQKGNTGRQTVFETPKVIHDCEALAKDGIEKAKHHGGKPEIISIFKPPLPKIQKAPPVQETTSEILDWPTKKKRLRKEVSEKWGHFSYLSTLSEIYGIQNNTQKLMGLAKRARDQTIGKSARELFSEEYLTPGKNYQKNPENKVQTSIFKWLKAGLFYLFMHRSGLIQKTIKTYLKSYIRKIEQEIKQENGSAKTEVISKALSATNQFLENEKLAHKTFAEGKGSGDLMKDREAQLLNIAKLPLKELCEGFSQYLIDNKHASPKIRFFKTFQSIKVIGWIFEKFEGFVNRVIIQRSMKTSIALQIESFYKDGLEVTKHNNLPITLNILKFFTSQLQNLSVKLQKDLSSNIESEELPGTDLLETVIKNLMQNIQLNPNSTSNELKKQIQELENPSLMGLLSNLLTKLTNGTFEEGILEGGHLLINYLNDTIQSGELISIALELSLAPFDYEEKTPIEIKKEFDKEFDKFAGIGKYVLGLIIDIGARKETTPPKEEDEKHLRAVKTEEFGIRKKVMGEIAQKISLHANQLSTQENTHKDLASIFNSVLFLTDDPMITAPNYKNLDEIPINEAIIHDKAWKELKPRYGELYKICQTSSKLQDLEISRNKNLTAIQELGTILDILSLKTVPQQHDLQNLENAILKIQENISPTIGNPNCFNELSKKSTEYVSAIENKNKQINSIEQFSKQIKQLSVSPTNKSLVAIARKLLNKVQLSHETKTEWTYLINASNWDTLKTQIASLQATCTLERNQITDQLKTLYTIKSKEINDIKTEIETALETSAGEKTKMIDELQTQATEFENRIKESPLPISSSISQREENLSTLAQVVLPPLAGYQITRLLQSYVPPVAAFALNSATKLTTISLPILASTTQVKESPSEGESESNNKMKAAGSLAVGYAVSSGLSYLGTPPVLNTAIASLATAGAAKGLLSEENTLGDIAKMTAVGVGTYLGTDYALSTVAPLVMSAADSLTGGVVSTISSYAIPVIGTLGTLYFCRKALPTSKRTVKAALSIPGVSSASNSLLTDQAAKNLIDPAIRYIGSSVSLMFKAGLLNMMGSVTDKPVKPKET